MYNPTKNICFDRIYLYKFDSKIQIINVKVKTKITKSVHKDYN